MPYYLTTDGVNQSVTLPSYTTPSSGLFTIRVDLLAISNTGITTGVSLNRFGGRRIRLNFDVSNNEIEVRLENTVNTDLDFVVSQSLSSRLLVEYEIDFDNDTSRLLVDGVQVGTETSGYDYGDLAGLAFTDIDWAEIFGSQYLEADLYSLQFDEAGTVVRDYVPSSSGLVLVDAVSAANGTLRNYNPPNDDSQWVFYSAPSAGVSGDASFALNAFAFASAGSASLPQPSGSIGFDLSEFAFASTGSASLPQPIGIASLELGDLSFAATGSASFAANNGNISFDLSALAFSATGSATQPQPSGAVSFDIGVLSFTGTANASLPQPSGSVSIDLGTLTFAATGTAEIPQPDGSINFDLNTIGFSGIGSATLPQPIALGEFDLGELSFSATGGNSGFIINPNERIDLRAGRKYINLIQSQKYINLRK